MAMERLLLGGLNATSILAWFGAFIFVFVLVVIAFYVYYALVLSTIAKKLRYDKPWLAWIPIVNLALYPILAEYDWPWVFILLVPIVNIVFMFIWTWKIFERRNYPGWLSLIPLASFIPIINIFVGTAMLIIWGLVAWADRK